MSAPARPVRTALVTGAAGAFGSATLVALRSKGVRVVGLDVRPDESNGVLGCDLTDPNGITAAVAAAVEQVGGHLDLVVHYAGIGPAVDVGRMPGPEVDETLAVNLLGTWRVTAAALPFLADGRAGRGRVIAVASMLSYITVPFAGAYTVSKRGLTGYTDTLRAEYGELIAVTTVLPGYVDTPIHNRARAAGVALDGLVPAEKVSDIVGAVMSAAGSPQPPREITGSATSRVGRLLARSFPWLVEHGVRLRMGRAIAGDGFSGELAQAMRERRRTGRVPGVAQAATPTDLEGVAS